MAVATPEPQELVARGYDRAAEQYARPTHSITSRVSSSQRSLPGSL
jgi:hypothetical protein